MRKERIIQTENTEIETLFEKARPLVEKYASIVAKRAWRIPPPRLDFSLDLREKSEWEMSHDPSDRAAAESLGTYFFRENRLAINLTEFRESTADDAGQLKNSGFERVDPQLLNSLIILAHDGVVHKNCQERQVLGELHDFLFNVGEEFLEKAGMSPVIERLDKKEGSISLRGAAIYYHLTDGSVFSLGKTVDESFVFPLTSEVVIPCLRDLYSLSWSEAANVYSLVAGAFPSPDSIIATAGFLGECPLATPLFFSGRFLNHFVFNLEDEEKKMKALSLLALGKTKQFLQTIQ